MPAKKYRVFLNGKNRSNLERLVNTGTNKARTITRARILLLSDESLRGMTRGMGKTDKEITEILGVSARTVAATRQRYVEGGMDEAKLAVIACSEPPLIGVSVS